MASSIAVKAKKVWSMPHLTLSSLTLDMVRTRRNVKTTRLFAITPRFSIIAYLWNKYVSCRMFDQGFPSTWLATVLVSILHSTQLFHRSFVGARLPISLALYAAMPLSLHLETILPQFSLATIKFSVGY
jgi:hypothetical protein